MSGRGRPHQSTEVMRIDHRPLSVRVRQISLAVTAGPDAGARAVLAKRALTVGTDPSNDMVLTDPAVSRFHFRIVADDRGHRLIDSGSTNGTFVNGVRVERGYVADGVQITAGNTGFAVRFEQDESEIELSADDFFGECIGRSVAMREVFAVARRAAASDATVLLLGETGTGKDVLARAIHGASLRAAQPFVVCDCSAIPDNLVESALFGHVRGSFTGAERDQDGFFQRAHGGTLFLDEIGELPLALQPKLLRALDGHAVTPVGGTREDAVDVRVIAATNRDLAEMVEGDGFRADLFYRLAVVTIELPPLRERGEDIPLLAERFLREVLVRWGKPADAAPAEFEAVFSRLLRYRWPGNIRELRNVCERAVAISDPAALAADVMTRMGEIQSKLSRSIGGLLPMQAAREQFDREYLRDVIEAAHGDIKRAAEIADIHPKSLERLLRKYGRDRQ